MERSEILYNGGIALDKLEREIIEKHKELGRHTHNEVCCVMDTMLVYILHIKFGIVKQYKNTEPALPFRYVKLSKIAPPSVYVTELTLLSRFLANQIHLATSEEKTSLLNSIASDLSKLLKYYQEPWPKPTLTAMKVNTNTNTNSQNSATTSSNSTKTSN